MTFNSRLAKLADKLAEEHAEELFGDAGFDLQHYKHRLYGFTRGALHPTIEAAIRLDERRRTLLDVDKTNMALSVDAELQRLLSEGAEERNG